MIRKHYWIDIFDVSKDEKEMADGFWVVFLRKNIGLTESQQKEFENRVWSFMEDEGINFVRISLPYYDRLIVFTSCDKGEITETRRKIQRYFSIKDRSLIWKAAFESHDGWESGNWLDLLDTTFSAYEKQLKKAEFSPNNSVITLKSRVYQNVLEVVTMNRNSMVIRPVFKSISYVEDENTAFVLMPFGETWSNDVYHLIKKVGDDAQFIIKRADDFFEPNIIIDDIWESINRASIIIADISVHNANVFYELGIAHTLGKKVILVKQKKGVTAPFDIRAWRYIEYDITPKEADTFTETLKKVLVSHREKNC